MLFLSGLSVFSKKCAYSGGSDVSGGEVIEPAPGAAESALPIADDPIVNDPIVEGDGSTTETGGVPPIGVTPGQEDTGAAGSGCADGSYIFCEDFEALTDLANGKFTIQGTGELTADQAIGKQALHLAGAAGGPGAFLIAEIPETDTFYGKANIFVSEFSTSDKAHFTMVEAVGPEKLVLRPIGGQTFGGSFLGVGMAQAETGLDWTRWQKTVPTTGGKWVCYTFKVDGTEKTVDISIDGKAVPDLSITATQYGREGQTTDPLVLPKVTSVKFGWQLYQKASLPSSYDIYLDDLAISNTELTC